MTFDGFWSLLPPPIWNNENEQGWQVFHCASAAAIFMGWYLASITPSSLPTTSANSVAGTSTISANRAERSNTSGLDRRRTCQAETPSITTDAVTSEASST